MTLAVYILSYGHMCACVTATTKEGKQQAAKTYTHKLPPFGFSSFLAAAAMAAVFVLSSCDGFIGAKRSLSRPLSKMETSILFFAVFTVGEEEGVN